MPVYVNGDSVDHPPHYNTHPSGVECLEVVRLCSFDLGNGIKYIWRSADKNGDEDLRKARFYLRDLLATGQACHPPAKARTLLEQVVMADPHPIRSNLLSGIVYGKIETVIKLITSVVGEDIP